MNHPIYKNSLLQNWGSKAEAMACFAEVRIFDPASLWACYILAMNPEDEDEIVCIIDGFTVEFCHWSLKELCSKFNDEGQYVMFDTEYKPMRAAELFKTLNERKPLWNQKE